MLSYLLGGLCLYRDEELGTMVRHAGFTSVRLENQHLVQYCFARRDDRP
jgi:hypothetical protein